MTDDGSDNTDIRHTSYDYFAQPVKVKAALDLMRVHGSGTDLVPGQATNTTL